jgi:translation initiation factor 3 subunit C
LKPDVAEKTKVDWNPLTIDAKLKEIREMRGRRSNKIREYIDQLEEILEVVEAGEMKVEVIKLIVVYQFELAVNAVNFVMKKDVWNSTCDKLMTLLDMFEQASEEDKEELRSNFIHYIERLNDELRKVFVHLDPQTPEYVDRLRDNGKLAGAVRRLNEFYASSTAGEVGRLALITLENVHYVHSDLASRIAAANSGETFFDSSVGLTAQVEALARQAFLIPQRDGEVHERALLMASFHYSLHGEFVQGKNYLQLAGGPSFTDPHVQVLYNRALAQSGLCAFACGKIDAAFAALDQIASSMRIRDFLGQQQSQQAANKKEERDEKRRLQPFHMHMNSTLIETIYFLTALLTDVPKIPVNKLDPYSNFQSAIFKRLINFYEKKVLVGPPENNRDYIV